jgi:hypothetical protein
MHQVATWFTHNVVAHTVLMMQANTTKDASADSIVPGVWLALQTYCTPCVWTPVLERR